MYSTIVQRKKKGRTTSKSVQYPYYPSDGEEKVAAAAAGVRRNEDARMGCTMSVEEKAAAAKSREIDRQIAVESTARDVKLLLLGK